MTKGAAHHHVDDLPVRVMRIPFHINFCHTIVFINKIGEPCQQCQKDQRKNNDPIMRVSLICILSGSRFLSLPNLSDFFLLLFVQSASGLFLFFAHEIDMLISDIQSCGRHSSRCRLPPAGLTRRCHRRK